MPIKLITDSAADIPRELAEELAITVLPFSIEVDGEAYEDRVSFTCDEFYEMLLAAEKIPTHSQITELRFQEEFEKTAEAGYDEIICVTINAKGSNTFNSAQMAARAFAEEHPDSGCRITVIDSTTYTMVYGYAVVEAAKKAKKGVSADEIIEFIEDWCRTAEVYFAPYSLDFAKKSGRISVAAAFVGELLGLRPIMTFISGESAIVEKVRGEKNIIPKMVEIAKARSIPQTPYLTLRGNMPEETEKLNEQLTRELGRAPLGTYCIGAAIAINAGPNLVAVIVKGAGDRKK